MATLTNQQLLTSLYIAAFGRAPDKSGLAYWKAQVDSGLSFDAVISSFLGSAEAVSLIGSNPSDQIFLNNLYSNVLSRAADTGGAQYWQGRLDSLQDRGALVKEFISSVNAGSGSDTKLLQNKIEIGEKFAASVSGNNTIYAKAMMAYVTSEKNTLEVAQGLNNAFDGVGTPAKAPLDFYGKSLKFDFFVGGSNIDTTTALVSDAVEFQVTGFSFDAGHGSFKIATTWPGDAVYGGVNKLVLTDVNNSFDPFVGFNVLSNGLVNINSGVGYNTSNITVAENSIEIILTGVNLKAGTALEFTVLT